MCVHWVRERSFENVAQANLSMSNRFNVLFCSSDIIFIATGSLIRTHHSMFAAHLSHFHPFTILLFLLQLSWNSFFVWNATHTHTKTPIFVWYMTLITAFYFFFFRHRLFFLFLNRFYMKFGTQFYSRLELNRNDWNVFAVCHVDQMFWCAFCVWQMIFFEHCTAIYFVWLLDGKKKNFIWKSFNSLNGHGFDW